MALMQQCAKEGTVNSLTMGAIYEEQRNLKISSEHSEYEPTGFFDSYDAEAIIASLEEYNGTKSGLDEVAQVLHYTLEEVEMVAKVIYNESRGIPSVTEKACIAWTICNRVDAGYSETITGIITSPHQFAYS